MVAAASQAAQSARVQFDHSAQLAEQARLAVVHWRSSAVVGVLSVCGSAGWALALALQNAAKVRTLGQVELLFTFAVSRWWLHDRHSRAELAASGLVALGVLAVVVAG